MSITPPDTTIRLTRRFSTPGRSPYDEVAWDLRDARLTDFRSGEVVFEQTRVEFPADWSVTASNIVAQKYFRGQMGSGRRERSLRQVIDRVVGRITEWGERDGYFSDADEAATFSEELRWLLLHQRVSFNSPVWFNIGTPGAREQAAACFILDVEDDLASILNWYEEEGTIFKGGSGAGANLSKIRSSKELLSAGGTPSGPVSFMRGADASAGTIKSGGTTRRAAKMVILDADHPDIEEFVWCKAIEERKARVLRDAGFDMDLDGADSFSVQYQNANNSVRLTDEFMQAALDGRDWELTSRTTGEVVETVPARRLLREIAEASWECADPGVQFDTTINRWNTTPHAGRIDASNPCSEHLRLANSACNLASINLLSYLSEDGEFDAEAFEHTVRVVVTAQDILVGGSEYPTDKIAAEARAARDIGIGYTNLGAALMALGLPYDSEDGRAWAATITGIMTGAAAVRSTELAARLGPAPLFEADADAWSGVYRMHLDAARAVDAVEGQPDLNQHLVRLWTEALDRIAVVGARNAELSVAAPTGTISFMMGADTTGIEPDLGLVKHKKLVGGGSLQIVNQTVPRALRRLGYDDAAVERIVAWIDENHSVVGCPDLDAAHLPVFACAMGDNPISYGGHLRMMSAIQPFFSGAMSKTVNVPEDTSVDDVEQLLIDAWRSGIKCVALYRDNCKVGQPLTTGKKEAAAPSAPEQVAIQVVEQVARPVRERLPRTRRSRTFEFRVADCKGFVTVGEYEDGRPGELFIRVSKQGSTLAGIMDAFAISVSHGLQYGVPLRAFVGALVGMRFEPAGMTDDPEVRIANSLVDYLFRRLALEYIPYEERVELGILGVSERLQPTLPGVEEAATPTVQGSDAPADPPTPAPHAASAEPIRTAAAAPLCMTCGVQMTRAGSCFVCTECGTTSGCS
ncbi:MAG TPA: vitamin B12-dependent ribonucleotide reductase [Microthrixaceae bacterium]|mgnify:FL=1|nr:vitamin B12-dependent ribonucleotide reductase [Microthrixaceae bacterium]HMX64275.1 vitamin B12-dependent ribonucleotide reductase [Microthrixaceae bacterium]HMY88050.1 vitamin B12-dependent ribonucleotide reductase [Microthrixaceae bacterium]HNA36090.1 vitamin B12-dependent ribonucleotide reductase [Microthrixaceae bacterium]HNB94140.1 vitamin B12-dependent ribonucleotide reductase [Microthrixaceae bacterium]